MLLSCSIYGSYYPENYNYGYDTPQENYQSYDNTERITQQAEYLIQNFHGQRIAHDSAIMQFPWQSYLDLIIEQKNRNKALEFVHFLDKSLHAGIDITIDLEGLINFIMHSLLYKIKIYLNDQNLLNEHNRKFLEKEIHQQKKTIPQFILSRYTSMPNNMITQYNQAKAHVHHTSQPTLLEIAEASIRTYYEILANPSSTELHIKNARLQAVQNCGKVRPESRSNLQDDLIAQFLVAERERKKQEYIATKNA